MKRVKITGARGDWTAEVEARRLAVIHDTWFKPKDRYLDPMQGADLNGKRYQDFLTALQSSDKVVMQRDIPGTFTRNGYVGVFFFKDLVVGDDGSIGLTLTGRYADPK